MRAELNFVTTIVIFDSLKSKYIFYIYNSFPDYKDIGNNNLVHIV